MHYIFFIIFSFFSGYSISKEYVKLDDNMNKYSCLEKRSAGFDSENNFELTNFIPKNFELYFDRGEKSISSRNIGRSPFDFNSLNCNQGHEGIMTWYCNDTYGSQNMAFNTITGNFIFQSGFLSNKDFNDSIWLSYGVCKKVWSED